MLRECVTASSEAPHDLELLLCGDLARYLVAVPGSLVEQWQDELSEKSGLQFDIWTRSGIEASVDVPVFAEHPLLIARMDQMSRSEELLAHPEHTDLVVDEARQPSGWSPCSTGRRSDRVWALLGFAVLAGVFSTWALQGVIGALTGTWLANAGVMALLILGIAAGTAGLATLLGVGGVGLSAAVVFFFGMPFSGAATAWQMVPTPWGQIAQYLPVGAGNTALRGVAFFGGAGATAGLVVLAIWAVVGLLLTGLLLGSAHAASEPEAGAEAAVPATA